jgi:hypothetical protein
VIGFPIDSVARPARRIADFFRILSVLSKAAARSPAQCAGNEFVIGARVPPDEIGLQSVLAEGYAFGVRFGMHSLAAR